MNILYTCNMRQPILSVAVLQERRYNVSFIAELKVVLFGEASINSPLSPVLLYFGLQ